MSRHLVRQVDSVRRDLRLLDAVDPLDVGQQPLQLQGDVRIIEGGVVEGQVGAWRGGARARIRQEASGSGR